MSVQQQPGSRPPDSETDSYPEPKRSWGRTGSLLATWGVLLLAVYFGGWVFDSIVDKSPESSEEEAPASAKSAAWQFLNFALADRHPNKADGLMCEANVKLSGTDVFAELTDWEATNDASANVALAFTDGDDPSGGGSTTVYSMDARLESGSSLIDWTYEVSVQKSGSTFCISKVENVTPEQD